MITVVPAPMPNVRQSGINGFVLDALKPIPASNITPRYKCPGAGAAEVRVLGPLAPKPPHKTQSDTSERTWTV